MYNVTELDSIVLIVAEPKPVTSIELSETSIILQLDESKRLTAIVLPVDADNPAVTWSSNNDAVAEVNNGGRVTANAIGTCTITCSATDDSGVKAECQVRVKKADTMEWVDLGLPSGTLWATCNVGASSPEEYGDYFAWGETTPKSTYNWSTYFDTEDGGSTFKKYYWSRSLGTSYSYYAFYLRFDSSAVGWGSYDRNYGRSVRPVRVQE